MVDKGKARRAAARADVVLDFMKANSVSGTDLDSIDSREKHNRELYEECRIAAEQEAQAAAAKEIRDFEDRTGITKLRQLDIEANNRLEKIWQKPQTEIRAIYEHAQFKGCFDPYHTMVLVPANDVGAYTWEQVLETAKTFYSIQIQAGVEYSEADLDKIGFYISANGLALAFGNRKEVLNPLDVMTWIRAADRLEQLGAIKPKRTVSQPTPAPVFADDKAEAEYGYLQEALPIFTAWTEQLRRDYGYEITQAARAKVCEYMDKRNLNPLAHESYDAARRWAAVTGIFPLMPNGDLMLTPDENLARRVEIGEVNLNTPEGRRYYHYELNRIEAAKAGS
jgi:hypothetical protein